MVENPMKRLLSRLPIIGALLGCSQSEPASVPTAASVGHPAASVTADSLLATANMAGFLAAHGILCVSEGGPLIPFVGMEAADGKRSLERLVTERLEDGVAEGMERLKNNPSRSLRAILVFDGFVTLEMGRTDALIVQAHIYETQPDSLEVVVPYRSVGDGKTFGVYSQRITQCEGRTVSDELINEAFMRGVRSHTEGAKVWDAHVIRSK